MTLLLYNSRVIMYDEKKRKYVFVDTKEEINDLFIVMVACVNGHYWPRRNQRFHCGHYHVEFRDGWFYHVNPNETGPITPVLAWAAFKQLGHLPGGKLISIEKDASGRRRAYHISPRDYYPRMKNEPPPPRGGPTH